MYPQETTLGVPHVRAQWPISASVYERDRVVRGAQSSLGQTIELRMTLPVAIAPSRGVSPGLSLSDLHAQLRAIRARATRGPEKLWELVNEGRR
jgi:hypothetical protein